MVNELFVRVLQNLLFDLLYLFDCNSTLCRGIIRLPFVALCLQKVILFDDWFDQSQRHLVARLIPILHLVANEICLLSHLLIMHQGYSIWSKTKTNVVTIPLSFSCVTNIANAWGSLHSIEQGKNRGQDAFALYADANFLNGILAAADDSRALRYSSFRSIGEKLVCKKMFLARFQGRERESNHSCVANIQ